MLTPLVLLTNHLVFIVSLFILINKLVGKISLSNSLATNHTNIDSLNFHYNVKDLKRERKKTEI